MKQDQNVRIAISFVVGLIVGVGGYWLIARHNAPTNSDAYLSPEEVATTTQETVVMQGDNGLSVSDQAPGNSVTINQVVLKYPSWVAIHDDVNGEPGRILGAKLFDVGTSSGVVNLLRNTVSGTKYFAVIHKDDGDYHNFNAKTDKIVMNGNSIVEVLFTASSASTSADSSLNF